MVLQDIHFSIVHTNIDFEMVYTCKRYVLKL